jgi:hypothetical protein
MLFSQEHMMIGLVIVNKQDWRIDVSIYPAKLIILQFNINPFNPLKMNRIILSFGLLFVLMVSCRKNSNDTLKESTPYLQTDTLSLTFPETAGTKDSFLIKSNINWQITVSPATSNWLTTSVSSGNGDIKVLVSITKDNISDTIQIARIIISPVNNTLIKPITITVSQSNPEKKVRNAFGGTGSDDLYMAVATADGGIIAVGDATSRDGDLNTNKGQEDAWIIKLDASGNKVWSKSLGGSGRDAARVITPTKDGNFLIAASGSTDGDFTGITGDMVVKMDPNGNIIWKKNMPIAINAIIPATAGGFVLVGQANNDYAFIKTDNDLNVLWQKSYGGTGYDYAYSVVEASDNGYVLAGHSSSTDGNIKGNKGGYDFCVIKVDINGNLLWQKNYGGSGTEFCGGIERAQDGGYVIAGTTSSSDGDIVNKYGNSSGYGEDSYDGWVIKIDANGNKVWTRTLGGTMQDQLTSIRSAIGGGILLAGYTKSNDGIITDLSGRSDAWVLKLAEDGSLLWSKTPGGNDEEYGSYMLEQTTGKYVLISNTFSNDGDVFGVINYNSNFANGWIYRFK